MTDQRRLRLASWGAVLLLVAAVVAIFLPTMDFSHLRLDDALYTTNCPFVKGGLSWANVGAAFADPAHGAIWMPLTYLSYMCDVTLLGGEWASFHFTNVVLHCINVLLLFALLRRLQPLFGCDEGLRACGAAVLGALVWAVHPMRAEAVAWVAARKEELWSLFAFSALLAWLRFLNCGRRFPYLLTFGLFVLACLSKPTALCFPLLAFAVQRLAMPNRRIRPVIYLPFVLVALAVGLLTVYSQSNPTGEQGVDIYDTSIGWRLLNAAVSFGLYVWHTFIPAGIHFDYRAVFEGRPLGCLLGLATLLTALVAWSASCLVRGRPVFRRVAALSFCWWTIPLVPALGVFGIVGDHAMADRYTYFAAGALAFVLAVSVPRLRNRAFCAVAAIAVAAVAGEIVVTRPVVQSFRNDLEAFTRILKFDPDHWRALHFVGSEYCARNGKYDEGLAMIRRSLSLSPRPSTAATLAYLLAYRGQMGDFAEVRRLGARVSANPKLDREGMMLDALGVAALRDGNDRAAVAYFTEALTAPKRQHTKSHAMLNLGIALANIGCDREALQVLRELRQLRDKWVRDRALEVSLNISQGGHRARIGWK